MTFSEPIWARSATSPSVIPSARYVLSGLLARSWKGSTATAVIRLEASEARFSARFAPSHHVAATTARPAPSAAATRRPARGPERLRKGTGVVARKDAPSGDSSASRNRCIEGKRSTGSFAMACLIAPSTACGTVWRTTRRLGTGSSEWRAITA